MKSKTEYLTFNIPTRCAFVNITPSVRKTVEVSGIKEGLCLVNAMHITASVFINDNESGLHQDYDNGLNGWHLIHLPINTSTMIREKIMLMHI